LLSVDDVAAVVVTVLPVGRAGAMPEAVEVTVFVEISELVETELVVLVEVVEVVEGAEDSAEEVEEVEEVDDAGTPVSSIRYRTRG
jgi:hypothetical protein